MAFSFLTRHSDRYVACIKATIKLNLFKVKQHSTPHILFTSVGINLDLIYLSTMTRKDISSVAANCRCRLCAKPFDNFGDMQRLELIKHVQEGDIDNQLEK